MKFVLSQPLNEAGMELLRGSQADIYVANSADPHEYLDELKTADAFIVRIARCDASVIAACPQLKVIGRTGVGYDNVDCAYATQAGIPLVITPGANALSVAEHVLALMFALSKNLCQADSELRRGNWQIRDAGRAFELSGRKVGIVGVGSIGREVARLCRGIGMKTAGYNRHHPQAVVDAGCELYEDLPSLLRDCDVISLHCPLVPETKGLISAPQLAMMKPGSLLINCSRGPVVNTADLAEALRSGRLAGAGIDVYEEEPADLSDPVFSAPNVLCTPHCAAQTAEATARMACACVKGCLAVCRGEQWPYIADRRVYEHPRFC